MGTFAVAEAQGKAIRVVPLGITASGADDFILKRDTDAIRERAWKPADDLPFRFG